MPLTSSVSFLRYVLWADAISCLACGLLQVTLTTVLTERLGLPATLLADTGIFLAMYGAAVLFLATRTGVPSAIVWLLIAGNMAWALACIAVLLGGVAELTLFGKGYVVLQASAVAILAQLQYAALRYHKSSNNRRALYSDHANL
ncbi:MAG: hypothetical protein ACLPWG_06185 [Steroidobacteraceae bacterium]